MKHIVCTVTNDLTYDQRMDRICTSLTKAGYFVTLIGFVKTDSIDTLQKPYAQVRLRLMFKKGKLFYLEYNFRLFWYLLFRRFDIYNGIDLDTLLPVFVVAKLKRKPIVHDAHEYFTELPEIVDRPVIQRAWKWLAKRILPHVKNNYTVGEAIATALQDSYKNVYHVIRNVPVLNGNVPIEKGDYILYQGALNKGRGLEALMQAMQMVDAPLYIAGEGDLSDELRNMAATLPHANKIVFLGYIRPDELKTFTAKAKIGINFVEPLGLSYYYSLSNKFFDYIHAGIPQVTMDFPEYKRLNDLFNIALLIDEITPEKIAAGLNTLLNDAVVYNKLAANTQAAKRELNWQSEEEKLVKLYRQFEK